MDQSGFELETFIDAISVSDKIGKEVVLNVATTVQNNKTFYTDSNGLEEQKRVLDYRPTWPLVQFEPASGNYYPVNSHISILDVNTKQRVSLLVDRSQGGSVIRDGNLEIMIQRRTTMDDSRGVGEPLDENGITQKVRHFLVIGDGNRAVQKANDQRIIVSWAQSTATFAKHPAPKPTFTVPDTVKIYLRPFSDDSYLLRLMNFDISKSVCILLLQTMVNVPAGWTITEYALGFNQLLSDMKAKKYTWREEKYELYTGETPNPTRLGFHLQGNIADGTVDLKPFEIRTFKLTRTV